MSKLAHSHPDHQNPAVACEYCGAPFDLQPGTVSSRVAWEFDLTLCENCACDALQATAENGQFGVGA